MVDRHLRIARRIIESAEISDVEATSRRLGYNLSATHVGYVLWADHVDDDDDNQTVHLAQAARRWFTDQDLHHPLLLPVDEQTLWAWHPAHRRATTTASPPSADAPLRVAIGQPAGGVAGFRTTHHEALAARRTALDAMLAARVVRHAEVETLSLITAEEDVLRRFVWHKLGRLARDDDRTGKLRAAVRAYLEAGGQVGLAASMTGVHRNTLARRVEAASALRPLDYDRVGLSLALELAVAHGPRVLTPKGPASRREL
jgi:sugar diacid utilization regulator